MILMDYPQDFNALNIFAQMQGVPLIQDSLEGKLGITLVNVGKALLILIIGLIFANIVKGQIKKWLKKTDVDNRFATMVVGESPQNEPLIPTEKWISEIVGWIITLFVIVAFLDALELQSVSQPLNLLLGEITKFLPRIGGAALLILLAWGVATIVKLFVTRILTQFRLDEKLNAQVKEDGTRKITDNEPIALSETIGNALYWFVYLLFLPSILTILQLEGTLSPLNELVNDILGILPNVFAAIIIAFLGWIVAQVVKKVVINLLTAIGVNNIGAKFGLSTTNRKQSLAYIIGSVVYVLVLIPIAITALDALQIQAISTPAIAMLNQVLDILPKLFAAIIIIGLAYFGGQYLSELVTDFLTTIGFNNIFVWLGITKPSRRFVNSSGFVDSEPQFVDSSGFVDENPTNTVINKTPAEIVGAIVLVSILLVASLTAVDILQINALKQVVAFVLLLGGQILVGVVILGIGLYFANLVFKLIANSGTHQANLLAQVARISIIVLVSAMALERIGIAPNIVNLAFGLLMGGIAVAIALAFGLGGRKTADKLLQQWLDSFNQK
jgi:Conserved TM helix